MVNQIVAILDYFFGFNPGSVFPMQNILWGLIGFSLLLALTVYLKMKSKHDNLLKKHLREYPGKLVTISVLLTINIFSRLNRVEVLSMRFITYILVIWLLFSFYELYKDFFVYYPKEKSLRDNRKKH